MTDFAAEELLGRPGVICTPHLGASTPEAEDNCAIMAAQELSDYLRNGNITHSVNMPDVQQPRAGGRRICVIHRNEPGVISQITALTTAAGLNIENMVKQVQKRHGLHHAGCHRHHRRHPEGQAVRHPGGHPGAHPVKHPSPQRQQPPPFPSGRAGAVFFFIPG